MLNFAAESKMPLVFNTAKSRMSPVRFRFKTVRCELDLLTVRFEVRFMHELARFGSVQISSVQIGSVQIGSDRFGLDR